MPLRSPTHAVGLNAPAPQGKRIRRAFTLIELLVVITVIAILAGMLLAGIRAATRSARRSATKHLLSQLGMAIGQYTDVYGEPPPERLGSSPDYVSPECLTIFLARGKVTVTPNDARFPTIPKADFVPMRKAQFFDVNKNNCPEIIDAWGMPVVYNRTAFANDASRNFSDTIPPRHNPKSFDLFSCGPLASRMAQFGGQLPNVGNYENKAIEANPSPGASNYQYLYRYEHYKVARGTNEYIGNW